MKNLLFILLFIAVQSFAQINGIKKPLSIGEINTIHSGILNEDRTLNIYLPQTYNDSTHYPVIYLLDGTLNEDFIHIAGLTQFFNLMFQMPDCIVVGIANVDRKRDFTFHTELKDLKKNYPTTGHSEKFIEFIEKELQPYISENYRVNDTRYLIGQSLGGLLASEILLKKPHLFSHYFIISPSLWWDNESLLNAAPKLLAGQPDTERYVYVSVGKDEDKIMRREAESLFQILQKSAKKNLKSEFNLMQGENHATVLHRSIYEGFLRLFPYKN
ncbi:MAG: alpha/beta hydrolase [Cytophagaceae bacterium]|nr:alpha/beta hydrolase [Cytophagaceae bacterium]MBL0303258.1 alpha/beta hydrolase [Cytophagaceae bacterium]MBL0326110.1 alpha/beta hydrolase [Cytophagaceae bacterium]